MKKLSIFFLFVFACSSVFAQDQKGLLNENFSSNKLNWPIYSDTSANWKIENGLYIRENLKDFAYSTIKPVELDPERDYWVYLNTKHLGGVTNQAYGLSFGASDANNEFVFAIALSGHYEIYKRENGNLTEIVKWTETDAVNKSQTYDNSLWLIKEGKDWKFKINAKFVYSIPAQPLLGYNFGVTSSGIQTVAFDELNVNQVLDKSSPPIRTIVKDTVLFKEDFGSNTRLWPEYSNDEYGTSSVKNGKYSYDHKYESFSYSFYPVYIDEYQDFSISLSVTLIRGDSDYYGMCFGWKDVDNHYEFLITLDGNFAVYRMQAGKGKYIISLTPADAIKKGDNVVNILTMRQEEKSWKLYANDQLIGSCPRQSLYGNRVGITIANKQAVDFDDLIVKQINLTRIYKTKLCLIEKGILKEVDAEEAPYEITATINGSKQTIRKYSPPDFPGYAANQPWFKNDEVVQFKGMNFSKSGKPTTLGITELKKAGDYKTIGVYMDSEKPVDSSATIYIPVHIGCMWQAYEINCPSFVLNAPSFAPIGDTLTFTTDISGIKNAKYNWTISEGKIIKGQGTRSIQVSTEGLTIRSIMDVNVELNPRSPGCENKKSATVRVINKGTQGGRPQRTRN